MNRILLLKIAATATFATVLFLAGHGKTVVFLVFPIAAMLQRTMTSREVGPALPAPGLTKGPVLEANAPAGPSSWPAPSPVVPGRSHVLHT